MKGNLMGKLKKFMIIKEGKREKKIDDNQARNN